MASNQPMRSYQTTFLFNCRILLLLYVVELYNHINRAIRPSYGSSFKYSWMYVSGGLIMNIIGFCKIKKRAKVCEYVMYIVNGFIYIGAAVVLLIFHMSVGLHYIVLARVRSELLKMTNLTGGCREEILAELSRVEKSELSAMDPLDVSEAYFSAPRHADDTFSDMIVALAVWLCILFLTIMNVIVAIIEIKRLKNSNNRSAYSNGDLVHLHERVHGVLDRMLGTVTRRNPGPCDLPPSYDETCPHQIQANSSDNEQQIVNESRDEEEVTVETSRLVIDEDDDHHEDSRDNKTTTTITEHNV